MPIINLQEAIAHPENLSPQVRNLIATIVRNDLYLIDNTPINEVNGRNTRVAAKITKTDLDKAVELHKEDPFRTNGLFNGGIANLKNKSRVPRYIDASLDLEILLDRVAFPETDVTRGIPRYLMDGYTDMGQDPNNTERLVREKFRVEKDKLRDHLRLAREQAIKYLPKEEERLLDWIATHVILNMPYNLTGVDEIMREYGDRTVTVQDMLERKYAVCRHHAVLGQVLLQVTGKRARMEKGNHYNARHVWSLLEETPERIFDITRKSDDQGKSAIVAINKRRQQYYEKTPDERNHYKIVHR